MNGVNVAVVGGGVLGLASALSVLRRGAGVTLYDVQDSRYGASGVAAGMLAPAFEAALDPVMTSHGALLRAARDFWPALADELDLSPPGLAVAGAIWVALPGEQAELAAVSAALMSVGAPAETITAHQARRLQPSLSSRIAGAVFTPSDWTLDPRPVLQAMTSRFVRLGGKLRRQALGPGDLGALKADAVVLAIGAATASWRDVAVELVALTPVKGQILHFRNAPLNGVTVRGADGYVTPQAGGAIVGATMEVGVSDATPDPLVVARLRASAARLFPHLSDAEAVAWAGVRAATADGLPLVGPSALASAHRPGGPSVILATGARRNGWLLAPMIGEVVADHLAGRSDCEWARAFTPDRFMQTGSAEAARGRSA